MRLEAPAWRVLLPAALAAWAALAWALALAGMGTRLASPPPPPPPERGAAALPRLAPALAAPLRPDADYAGIAARPLFAPDRRPHPFFLGGQAGQAPAEVPRLTGVLITPQLSLATLTTGQGQSLRLRLQGEAQGGWRLLDLQPRQATVEGPGGVQTLVLQVFDGQGMPAGPGGAPPSAPAGPAPVPAAAAGAPAPGGPSRPPVPPPANDRAPGQAPGQAAPAPDPQTLDAIRERIRARRQQMQQQAGGAAPRP